MLPSLTADMLRRRPPHRAVLGGAGALLIAVALLLGTRGPAQPANAVGATLASTLAPGTWALSIPTSWFVAPIVGLRPGDHLDVLALRPGERATATVVAFDLLVVSADERAVVVGSGADDATALGVARASGLLLLPLLRSAR